MKEELKKIMMESLSSAMPYIVYPEELKEFIEKETEDCDSIEAFIEKLKKKIYEKCDIIRKTDGQIFLNELRHSLKKSAPIDFNPESQI